MAATRRAERKDGKPEKPTLDQLQWLIERMNAREEPITREQVNAFGRRPGGPILPEGCMAVERLPEYFGTRRDGSREAEYGWVRDFAVSSTGELWLATIVEGGSVLVNRGDSRGGRHFADGRSTFYLLEDDEHGTQFSPYIVGFRSDGTPMAALTRVASHSRSVYWEEESFLFIGGKRVFEGDLPKWRPVSVRVAGNDDVCTLHCVVKEHGLWRYQVLRNGELLLDTREQIADAWLLDDGDLVTVPPTWGVHHIGELHRWSGKKRTVDPIWSREHVAANVDTYYSDGIARGRKGRIVNVRGKIGDLRVTINTGSAVVVDHYRDPSDPRRVEVERVLGHHDYLAHDDVLPDGRDVYVGKTLRDQLQCFVCNGVAGPGFDRVSNVTVHDGAPHYYAILGQHLFTMELPEKAKAEE